MWPSIRYKKLKIASSDQSQLHALSFYFEGHIVQECGWPDGASYKAESCTQSNNTGDNWWHV